MNHFLFRIGHAIDTWKNKNKFEKNSSDPTIITVHVRRTDNIVLMKRYSEGNVPDVPYFKDAFEHYEKLLVLIFCC